jgi:photosystem II stability/assembly factor-like uncharacterized protein
MKRRLPTRVVCCRLALRAARRVAALAVGLALVGTVHGQQSPQWRVLPVRSQQEYNLRLYGGENTQHNQGIARSVSNPDVIYLSHDCGQTWRSDDGGATWRKNLCHGMYVHAGQSIEVDPVNSDVVFNIADETYNSYAANFQGLYRSTDGGENWTLVLPTTCSQQRFYQHNIAYDPTTIGAARAARWYAGFQANALYRSENSGDTWTQVSSLASHAALYAVHCHPTDGNTVYLATSSGLYVSTTRGTNPQPLGNLPAGEVSGLAIHPTTPTTLYVALRNKGLYRSTDAGATFTLLKSFDAFHVFLNPAYPNVIYLVGESTQSLVSSNGGSTWTKVIVTPPPGLDSSWKTSMYGGLAGVTPDPRDANKAVAYFNAEIWKTTDAGLHWTDSSTGFTGYAWGWWSDGLAFDVADPDRWVMFCCDVSVIKTENGGSWFTRHRIPYEWYQQGLITWPGTYSGDIQPIAGSQVIITCAGMYWTNKLCRSADGGVTWTIVCDDIENYLFIGFHPNDPNLVFAGNKKSTDAGLTWQTIAGLTADGASVVGLCRAQPDTVYAIASSRRKMLRSDDRGVTWRTYASTSWSYRGLDSKPTFAVHPTNPNVVYTLNSGGDLASFDGTTWRTLGALAAVGGRGATNNYVRQVAVDPQHPEIIYAEMYSSGLPGVVRSTDAGATWQNISANLPQVGGGGLYVHPLTGDLLHGSCFGTWVYPPPYDSPNSLYRKLIYQLVVARWTAAADHGAAGTFGFDVADGSVEPRQGLTKLVMTFSTALDPASVSAAAIGIVGQSHGDLSSRVTSAALDETGTTLTVTLSAPLADADRYAITLGSGLASTGTNLPLTLSGDRVLDLAVLLGDVDGSGEVTTADLLAVRAAAGLPVTAATARYDLDRSGTITGADLHIVHRNLGHTLP